MTTSTRVTVVWLVLVLATCLSWALGAAHAAATASTIALIVVAFVKVRLIGLHFMEIRSAPTPLRVAFEGYVVAVPAVLVTLTLAI